MASTELNGVLLQAFHWYTGGDGGHWERLASRAQELAASGFSATWLPPASKGHLGPDDVGYGVYDLYDLGEFDQKGAVRTRWGTREQHLGCIQALRARDLGVYADAVLNHRMGGDEVEQVLATPFAQNDRIRPSGAARSIRAYSHFKFPGRAAHHSSFEWRWRHFDAVDYDHDRPNDRGTIYLLDGKRFDDQVALDNGNYAYLMGCDLDFQNPEVQEEIARWGRWYLDLTGVDGFRLDAIKHISAWLFPGWLDEMERHAGRDLFVVGEYWNGDVRTLRGYLEAVGWRMSVFDVPLHYRLYEASLMGTQFDMRRIFDGTVVEQCPTHAVTFVDNHDSQPLQALESVVEPWFKPLAYALVLLRRDGYPCVFLADYDGAEYEDRGRDGNLHTVSMASHRHLIDVFLEARRACNHGPQYDYFDDPRCIGWTRLGTAEAPAPMAVLMSTGNEASKWMEVGRRDAVFRDVTGHVAEEVHTNADGWGEFRCRAGSVSVWRTA